jgi:pSer/pThr/pTyr-binding forkhead associated (FHA) protein
MYFTLTATSGPHVGKVLNLSADGSARIGRGEQADFSFPEDLNMSTNHFLIEARPTCGLLTDLRSTNGTFVNGEPVDEAIVANGDEIFAGETTFSVSLSVSKKPEHREPVRPIALSLDANSAAVCEGLQLTEDCQPLTNQDQTVAQFIDVLTCRKLYADALRVLSRAMGTPVALLWSCACVEEAQTGKLMPAEVDAIQAAKNWAANPSPAYAAEAHSAAKALNNEGPAAMLAMAAFWGAGSLVPADQPVIPVDPQLPSQSISGALTLVAVDGPPKDAAAKYETFIRKALSAEQ